MTDNRPVTEDDLHAYVDAVLDSGRRTEIEAYLETHPEIADRVRRYVQQRADLRAALRPIVEEPIPPELNLKRMIDARRLATASWWRAAAAILLICVGAGGGWSLRGAVGLPPAALPSGIEALAQEAADSYAVYAPDHTRPVEIRAADRTELVNWAVERLHHPLAVPDLSASGYRFMGGRMVATPHGPAVLFMYDNDHGTRLVMLSRRMEEVDQTARMTPHAQGDVDGFVWADDGIGYSLVGPLPSPTLHPIADEIRRQEKGV
jgi:anti-sigma factor RsiW